MNHSPDHAQAWAEDITYENISSSSQRVKHELIDSLGYSYTIKRHASVGVHWRSVMRNKTVNRDRTVREWTIWLSEDPVNVPPHRHHHAM